MIGCAAVGLKMEVTMWPRMQVASKSEEPHLPDHQEVNRNLNPTNIRNMISLNKTEHGRGFVFPQRLQNSSQSG